MTAPKKPRAAKVAPASDLTADQLRIAQHFAAMSDEAQEAMLRMAAAMAERLPRRTRPMLRLVGGGVK